MITPELFIKAIILPPKKAIEFLKKKDPRITLTASEFADMTAAVRAEAFTIAGVTKLSVLQDVLDDLHKAVKDGTTFEEFKKTISERMEKKGWLRKADQAKLAPYRLENIYRINTQSAYNAGRITQQKRVAKKRPYWQFNAVVDGSTTQGCRGLSGKVARYDDPFWANNYAPRHFACRSTVSTLSEAEIERDGIEITSSEYLSKFEPAKGFDGQPDAVYKPDLSRFDKSLVKAYKKSQ